MRKGGKSSRCSVATTFVSCGHTCFFGEPVLSSLNFLGTDGGGDDVSPSRLQHVVDYVCPILGCRSSSDVFRGENEVDTSVRVAVHVSLATLYFRWFDDTTSNRVHTSLRAITSAFGSLWEKLRYFRASFDVPNGDQQTVTALQIYDLRAIDWRQAIGETNVCIREATLVDNPIAKALLGALRDAKSALLVFSTYIGDLSGRRMYRLRGLFELESTGVLLQSNSDERDTILSLHCKQLYVYNFVVSYETVRKTEIVLDDFARSASALDVPECDVIECAQVEKAIRAVSMAYDFFSKNQPFDEAFERSMRANPYTEIWHEPEAMRTIITRLLEYLRAIVGASSTFSFEEAEEFRAGVAQRTGVQNIRLNVDKVREIFGQHANGDILRGSFMSQAYAHQVRLYRQKKSDAPIDRANALLDDIVENDYQTNERVWSYASPDWSDFAVDDRFLVTYMYGMVSENWLRHPETLRSVVRLYTRVLYDLCARVVIDYDVSPYDANGVEVMMPRVERFVEEVQQRFERPSTPSSDVVMRPVEPSVGVVSRKAGKRAKRALSVADDDDEYDEPPAKIFIPEE